MGRIKNKLIKRTTYLLLDQYKNRFSDNFVNNKKIVGTLLKVESKKIRNCIAGHITRLIRKEKHPAS